jgi:glutamate racemase
MIIGLFDSGIGGITVLHDALKIVKNADFLYYADTENVPYGTKTKPEVRGYVLNAADFLISHGADILVVACNTATSVAIEDLRQKYTIPIIGMEPAVKPAVENHKDKRILVTATELALKEEKLKKLITRLDAEDIVDLLPLPGLVRFAENLMFDEQSVLPYLKDALSPFSMRNYKTVVLGCTHFIYFKPVFEALLGPDIDIIDGNRGTVNKLLATITDLSIPLEGTNQITYYQSGSQVTDENILLNFSSLMTKLNDMDK